MKRTILSLATILTFSNTGYSQQKSTFESGLLIGANLSNVVGGQSQKILPGATLGGYFEIPLTFYKKVSLNIGLQYSTQGYSGKKYQQYNLDTLEPMDFEKLSDLRTHYLYLPITFNFYNKSGMGFFVGGQFGRLLDARGQYDINHVNPFREYINYKETNSDKHLFDQGYRSRDFSEFYETFDYGLTGGITFDVSNNMFLSLSAYYGLQDIYKIDNSYQLVSMDGINGFEEITGVPNEKLKFVEENLNFDPMRNFSFKVLFGYKL